MSVAACAERVERGDPDRFLTVMAAPPMARAVLFALYALNLEIARAPWASGEPLIAEMRLQWWRDAVGEIAAGQAPRGHEVLVAVAPVLSGDAVAGAVLDAMIEARRWDIWRDPFGDAAALWAHLAATAGGLTWLAARALDPTVPEAVAREAGAAAGMAAWLRAVPDYGARGRVPLPDPSEAAVRDLAVTAQGRLRAARAHRVPRAARPAFWPATLADPVLARAAARPGDVARATLAPSEFGRRAWLLRASLTGRW